MTNVCDLPMVTVEEVHTGFNIRVPGAVVDRAASSASDSGMMNSLIAKEVLSASHWPETWNPVRVGPTIAFCHTPLANG